MVILSDLYVEIIGYTRQGRTAEEIQTWALENHELAMSRSAVLNNLARWTDAGAFIVKVEKEQNTVPTVGGPADGHYGTHRVNRYYSNAVAMEPGILARALGVTRANKVLDRLGQPPIIIEPEPRRPALQPALIPAEEMHQVEAPRTHSSVVREPEPERPRKELPDMLFGAQFTSAGVLISYDQFHRVVALLQHATED